MTKFDLVLERLLKLPPEEREAIAAEIELRLDNPGEDSVLTDEQWAQVEAALALKDEPVATHDAVFARLEAEDE